MRPLCSGICCLEVDLPEVPSPSAMLLGNTHLRTHQDTVLAQCYESQQFSSRGARTMQRRRPNQKSLQDFF